VRSFWFAITGAVIGVAIIMWLGPSIIAWWLAPKTDTLFNCKPSVELAMRGFQWAQLAGLLTGSLLGLLVSLVFKRRFSSTEAL
jgi:hypothetical protein